MGKERLRTRRTCLLATMHSPPPPSLSLHSFQFTWEWNAAPPSSPAPPVSSSQWCQRCNWDKGQGERGKNLELGKNSRIPTLWKKERRRNKYVLLLLCVQVRLHYCCCCSCWSIEMHLHQTAIGEKKKKGLAIGSCWMEWRYQVNEIALASQGLRNTTWRHSKSVKFTFFLFFSWKGGHSFSHRRTKRVFSLFAQAFFIFTLFSHTKVDFPIHREEERGKKHQMLRAIYYSCGLSWLYLFLDSCLLLWKNERVVRRL